MATTNVGTPNKRGRDLELSGTGTNDDDVVIEHRVDRYETFQLQSTTGAMDVEVSTDEGATFVGPLSLADLGAVTTTPVLVTAAARMYGFRGSYTHVRVSQNAAAAVTGAILRCARWGNN